MQRLLWVVVFISASASHLSAQKLVDSNMAGFHYGEVAPGSVLALDLLYDETKPRPDVDRSLAIATLFTKGGISPRRIEILARESSFIVYIPRDALLGPSTLSLH